jgi:predicted small secreted protein
VLLCPACPAVASAFTLPRCLLAMSGRGEDVGILGHQLLVAQPGGRQAHVDRHR